MKSTADSKIGRRGDKAAPKLVPGGKALQRLFNYLARRDPAINEEVVESMAVPKRARPRFVLSKRALQLEKRPGKRTMRRRKFAPAAKPMAMKIAKAALALGAPAKGKKKGLAAPPAAAPAMWQSIGPSVIKNGQTYGTNTTDVIGRVSAIAVDPGDPQHLLLGAAGGGIWESADSGATWASRTDAMPSLAIGAVEFDPTAPNVVYAGSGEGNFYANLGAGVYKSNDGGSSWTVAATAPFLGIGFFRLVVDPNKPNLIYAATTHGFFKSTTSGATWTLKRSQRCFDLSVHPSGGSTELLAAFEDGLFFSSNEGNSFAAASVPSTPVGPWVRLAVDRVATTPDVAYLFGATASSAYLWRRSGTTWTAINSLPALKVTQAWYDWYVAAPPDDVTRVYVGAIDTIRGNLSGSSWTWTNVTTQGSKSIHPDQHCLAFSPGNSKIIYAGNDGGIFRSLNGGNSWTSINDGLGISEIEYLASDPNTWQWLIAGLQDNGTVRYSGTTSWDQIAPGDGGDCGVNQLNPNEIYHSYYNVSLEGSSNKGISWTWLSPPAIPSLFYPPVEVSGSTVAIGATSLLVTRNGNPPWTAVSLGLASGDVSTALRALDANTIIVGTKQGRVYKASWTGTKWTTTTLGSPASRYISSITDDPSNPQRLWLTISQVGGGTVYRSEDGGNTWVNCTSGLPSIPMNSVAVDPGNYQRVWVAADVGVYESLDMGGTWASFAVGLPNAIAADLLFHKQDRMLICATRNRGVWAIQVP
jgi:hypothetical protein